MATNRGWSWRAIRWPVVIKTVLVAGALVGLYVLLDKGPLKSQTLIVWGAVVAALGTTVAAFGASAAAGESRRAAQDARLALALASKPEPQIHLLPGTNSDSNDLVEQFKLTIENYSMNGTGPMLVTWQLRDGTAGESPIGPLAGRARPFGGMFHNTGPSAELSLGTHDASLLGTDEITLVFGDAKGSSGGSDAGCGPTRRRRTARRTRGVPRSLRTSLCDDRFLAGQASFGTPTPVALVVGYPSGHSLRQRAQRL